MKKIIGGLLVVSLLSRPTVIKINFIAYEIFKAQQKAAVLAELVNDKEKDSENEENKGNPVNIGDMINDISNNNKSISMLMKKQADVIEQIKSTMDFKVLTKNPMTEEQIKKFVEFNEFYKKEGGALHETLNKIDSKKDLTLVKREIMQMDSNYHTIEKEIKEITYYQDSAVNCLNSIIDLGEKTLASI